MPRQRKAPSMSAVLQAAIARSGKSISELARESGVARLSITRFVRGERSLRLDCADQLAAYLGLELAPRKR